jgi:hypothetical protein
VINKSEVEELVNHAFRCAIWVTARQAPEPRLAMFDAWLEKQEQVMQAKRLPPNNPPPAKPDHR